VTQGNELHGGSHLSQNPWLPSTTAKPEEKPETAKQKAHREVTLEETTQQVNSMIGEYFELHSRSTEPERVSNLTEAAEASAANIQLQTANRACRRATHEHNSHQRAISKHLIENRACQRATH
jgi:alpha-amylase/alpha-mannosidase (GH57 family)